MKHKFDFSGLGVAVITPFTERGNVDKKALAKIVENLVNNGVDYIVALGTTAETPTLTTVDKMLVIETVLNFTKGRVPVVVGVGSNNTVQTLEDIKYLNNYRTNNYTIDGLLLVSPYYNRPSQEGIYQHISAIATQSKLPIILYNIPSRCGCNIEPETLARLAKYTNIKAVKEASGSVMQVSKTMVLKPKHFNIISGDDSMALPFISLGAKGLISVMANAYPSIMSEIVHLSLTDNFMEAQKKFFRIKNMIDAIFIDGNPSGIKYLMSQLGYCRNILRLPLVKVSKETEVKIDLLRKNLENL